MASKILIVVAIAAFLCVVVNGRNLKSTDDEHELQKTFYPHYLPPYGKGFGGFSPKFGGFGPWFRGKPIVGGNAGGGFGNGNGDGGSSSGNGAKGATGTGNVGNGGGRNGDEAVVGGGRKGGQP